MLLIQTVILYFIWLKRLTALNNTLSQTYASEDVSLVEGRVPSKYIISECCY